MSVKSLDEQLCDGCGICVADCPMDVFKLDPVTHRAVVVYSEDCWDCFLCRDICPRKAIVVTPATARPRWHPL